MSIRLNLPRIIQGPDGAAGWRLASAVSRAGQLGVVSGNHVEAFLIRHLQAGDPGGRIRRLMADFPYHDLATRVQQSCFAGRRPAATGESLLAACRRAASTDPAGLAALAAFVEVGLAKEGHDAPVGISLTIGEGVPNLAVLYGAILAGVDAVLIQGQLPRGFRNALERLAQHELVSIKLPTRGPVIGPDTVSFDPRQLGPLPRQRAFRPWLIPIVGPRAIESTLDASPVDGVVVDCGLPEEGDDCRLSQLGERGIPYWTEGVRSKGCANAQCRSAAAGIYIRNLFAWCEEADHASPTAGQGGERGRHWQSPTPPLAVGLVTSGRDLAQLRRLLRGRSAYTAADVVTFALRYLSTRSERHPITTRLGATTLPTGDHRANRYALAWLLNEAPSTRASA
ncbi:MAG: hypothetical protein KF785_14705 [Gemmatimonadales bacterium]|nr:hypothetical protein [Gemmatimonadales bacterium]